MDLTSVAALLDHATSGRDTRWPLETEEPILRAINTWVALREGDRDRLREVAKWKTDRQYRVDPLPERISDAWAHYLFGQDVAVTTDNDTDTALMDDLIERDFPSELERAAGLSVSEGEVWARVYVDQAIADRPLLEWHSRASIFPYWVGPRLMAAALVTELPKRPNDPKGTVYRALEVHAQGGVVNVLYRGHDAIDGKGKLGELVELNAHPQTEALTPAWDHGLPGMLLHRIPNRIRRDRHIGVSDYAGIIDFLLDLNETASIGAHNVRLTARKRAVVSASALDTTRDDFTDNTESNGRSVRPPRPKFDAGEEVFVEDPLDTEVGGAASSPFRILEYSFDAAALIAWKRELVESALTRVGLAVQYAGVGAAQDGYAISGTALRLRLIPTDATGRGKARYYDDHLPRILRSMAQIDALSQELGGFGRPWQDPDELPTVTRRPGLPVDDQEDAQRHATLLSAGAESTYQAVRELHPEWTPGEVDVEVGRIKSEAPATFPPFGA